MRGNVIVGRLDNLKTVEVSDEYSIEEALNKANFTPAENEVVKDVSGNSYQLEDNVELGKSYILTSQVKSGC